jgi:hypothetical protein
MLAPKGTVPFPPTHRQQARVLTGVDDDVLGQVPHVHKGLAAHAALVGTDVVMVANVIGQLAGLDEPAGQQGREGLSLS